MSKKKEGTSRKSSSSKTVVSSMASKKFASKKAVVSIAPQEHAFITLDGKSLRTIVELAHELDQMADHVYAHHVTHDRNDFSNWIRDIFNEMELAKALNDTKDKHHTHILVLRHIVSKIPDKK